MRSKTSCFNGTLFRKNLSRYWPLWGLASFGGALFPLALGVPAAGGQLAQDIIIVRRGRRGNVGVGHGFDAAKAGGVGCGQKHRGRGGQPRMVPKTHGASSFQTGSVTLTRVPLPGSLSMRSALPWAAAMRWQSASPRPLPP